VIYIQSEASLGCISENEFDKAMEKWKELYINFSKPIKQYNNIDEFVKEYLED
jgi:hypothetical protein